MCQKSQACSVSQPWVSSEIGCWYAAAADMNECVLYCNGTEAIPCGCVTSVGSYDKLPMSVPIIIIGAPAQSSSKGARSNLCCAVQLNTEGAGGDVRLALRQSHSGSLCRRVNDIDCCSRFDDGTEGETKEDLLGATNYILLLSGRRWKRWRRPRQSCRRRRSKFLKKKRISPSMLIHYLRWINEWMNELNNWLINIRNRWI